MQINLIAVWIGFLLGGISGAIPGLFFRNSNWLGGYKSWKRRLIRLAHISFFGIAFINLAFVITVSILGIDSDLSLISNLLILGAITMPLICYLSAFYDKFRHLFFIPTLSVISGIILLIIKII